MVTATEEEEEGLADEVELVDMEAEMVVYTGTLLVAVDLALPN